MGRKAFGAEGVAEEPAGASQPAEAQIESSQVRVWPLPCSPLLALSQRKHLSRTCPPSVKRLMVTFARFKSHTVRKPAK